ncbi:HNH endonuclease [Photobacterium rosenbergii]|uniref:HNH endonuclease n=1 Tax=Photobacterium rosenbergii TaxID=294936 RepID=A0A2T3N7Z4_9GAMM|nr:HNH endonuclease [Photobacterium rosenbergii]PSW09229.1 HNH endonuclease [Photobacterium rosenbergii]
MSRKKFILSHGATCKNWTWSWSFINDEQKIIIFGAWDRYTDGNTTLILSEDWSIDTRGKKALGYDQSREHIRLIEEEGYQLMTFPLIYSNSNRDKAGIGPAKIKGFEKTLTKKSLTHIAGCWYATDSVIKDTLPEEVIEPNEYLEGVSKTIFVNSFERNAKARAACIAYHGSTCKVCDFDFKEIYGDIGEGFIHVHHLVPLADIQKEYIVDPINDLVPVCPNCHAMIHRTQPPLTISQLRKHIELSSGI